MHAPEREELDAVLLIREDLRLKLRLMFLAPVVSDSLQSEPHNHLRTLLGRALFRIKRNDAPRIEIR